MITNWLAAAGVTVMALVVALLTPLAGDHERVAGGGLGQRKVGEGGHAAGRRHGERAAERRPAGLLASATVTVPLNEESRLPELSSAWTVRPKGCPR